VKPIFCAAADDDTGATDLAGMLAGEGLRTVLVIEGPAEQWARGYDAVILGTGARALSASEAYSRTRAAVRELAALGPRVIEIKYCSTFDSTAEGNVGPSLDAAMDEMGAPFTVALPALPVNGRTTYFGHHFVNGKLLSDSPMKDHPLTPMRNPNLVTHLQSQTKRRVGLAAYPVTKAKLDTVQRDGMEIAILDCVSEEDLTGVCEAIADLPLISGSSSPAMRLPAIWRREGWWSPRPEAGYAAVQEGRGFLVVAGSCSVATRGQNEWLERRGAQTVVMDPLALLSGAVETPRKKEETLLLRTASGPDDVAQVHDWAAGQGLSAAEAGLRIAYAMARLVLRIVEAEPPAGLIVAGGETSGAICRTLGLGALEAGRNIDPGVPLCRSLGRFRLPVALKSGNFGSVEFYGKAIERIKESRSSSSFLSAPR
jgi:uncharacterized protein YgbK (DUF1537 family)